MLVALSNIASGAAIEGAIEMILTDKRAVLLALDDAIQWQQSWREANEGHDGEQVKEADERVAAYRRVYGRLTGGEATVREMRVIHDMRGAKPLSVTEIRRRIDSGEIQAFKIEL